MLQRNYTRMVHSDKNTLRPNSTVLLSMKMAFAIPAEPMEEYMFGTKSRIWDWSLKPMQEMLLELPALRASLFRQERMI